MAVDALMGALGTFFQGHPGLATAFGKIYLGQEPETFVPPFAVLYRDGETPTWTSGSKYPAICRVRFVVWAVGADQVLDYMNTIKQRFDWAKPPMAGPSGDAIMGMRRVGDGLEAEEMRDKNGKVVFMGAVNYEVWLQRGFN